MEGSSLECSTEIAFPASVESYGYEPAIQWALTVYNPVPTGGNEFLPIYVKRTLKYVCNGNGDDDGDRRRAARRLLGTPAPQYPWFRYNNFGQVVLGGEDKQLKNWYQMDYTNAPKGFVKSLLFYVEAVEAKFEVKEAKKSRRGDDDRQTPIAYGYVILQEEFYSSCASSCPAPVNLAVASCTMTSRKRTCSIATGAINPYRAYLVVISKPTLGLDPIAPTIVVRAAVDVTPNILRKPPPSP